MRKIAALMLAALLVMPALAEARQGVPENEAALPVSEAANQEDGLVIEGEQDDGMIDIDGCALDFDWPDLSLAGEDDPVLDDDEETPEEDELDVEVPILASDAPVIGVGEAFSLIAPESPVPASGCAFVSADEAVAAVSAEGVVTGKNVGETTVTVTPAGGEPVMVMVTVRKAPAWVMVTPDEAEVEVGRTVSLQVELPAKSASAIQWESSDTGVATVDADGVVTAVKNGRARIRATTFNGKTSDCIVRVPIPPTKVTISVKTTRVMVEETLTLKAKLKPDGAKSALKWKSSNPKVAEVDDQGVVTARKKGSAKISVTTLNGKRATVKITVKANPVTYRALVVGQVHYDKEYVSQLPACGGDANLMKSMLRHVKGGYGKNITVVKKTDLSYKGFKSAIESTFRGADDNDVSLLFYSGHGVASDEEYYEGALCMVPTGFYPLPELAQYLTNVPGRVVVMLDSCHSGAAIYQDGVAENSAGVSFDEAVVNAFAAADPGLREAPDGDASANVGDLVQSGKFYVLAASRRRGNSYTMPDGACSYFTKWLTDGVGLTGRMPADSNGDSVVTLNELFNYIKKVSKNTSYTDSRGRVHRIDQHVQVYPRKSDFELFRR